MYESLLNFPASPFAELERLQRELQQAFGNPGRPGSIRAIESGAFPAINIGSTPTAFVIYAFAPGVDPASLQVQVDRGVLAISGERPASRPEGDKVALYANERFSGRFRRTVSLSEDADPAQVEARMRDGVLKITIGRRTAAVPRRIEIQ